MDANTLFNNLGYYIVDSTYNGLLTYVKKNPDEKQSYDFRVEFNLNEKTFIIKDDWGDSYHASVQLLQAIVYKIKELKWV
jgi:hypothetical protein